MESPNLLLSDLPNEILAQICSTFCVHCTRYRDTWFDGGDKSSPWFAYGYRSDRNRPAIQTLRSLCLVSRRLGSVAQQFLYHAPPIENDDSQASWELARTFRSRPELASSIRLLPFLPRIASMGSIIAHATNLETLLVRPTDRLFHTQDWYRPFQVGSFPLLREVVINVGAYTFSRIKYDDLLPRLSLAAPNIRTLDVHLTRSIRPPHKGFVLPSVTKLVVRCVYGRRNHSEAVFEALIHAFPGVDDFELHWLPELTASRYEGQTIPATETPFHHAITKGLAKIKSRLQRLTFVAPTLRPRRVIEGFPSLDAGFDALEVLVLDTQTLDIRGKPKDLLRIPPSDTKEILVYGFRHNPNVMNTRSNGYDTFDLPILRVNFPRLVRIGLAESPLFNEHEAERAGISGTGIEVFRLPDWDHRM